MMHDDADTVRPRPAWLPAVFDDTVRDVAPYVLAVDVPLAGFADAVRALHDAQARFVTLFAADGDDLVAVVALRGSLIAVHARAPADGGLPHPPLGGWWPAAALAENEVVRRHGLRPAGWPGDPGGPDADRRAQTIHGPDVFEIPYGPIRSGVFEAIQFLIETGGEDILRLHTRLGFKHRGLESRCVGMTPDIAVHVLERIAGIAGVASATAFSQAVETASAVEAPRRAERWRVVTAEIERLANHLDVIAKEAETTSLFVGQARFQILKEDILRLQAAVTGSRFGRGFVTPGGVRHDGGMRLDALLAALEDFERALHRDRRLFLGTSSMTDRLIGTGHLPRGLADAYGAVGPLARGSGIATDARHLRPYGDYRRLGVEVQTALEGDAMARIEVRFAELSESLRLLREAIDHLRRSDGEGCTGLPGHVTGSGFGWAEAPQGELVVWVALEDGLVRDVHVASPSLRNWALFDEVFGHDVLTDFAFIEHSFGLTPAGADR